MTRSILARLGAGGNHQAGNPARPAWFDVVVETASPALPVRYTPLPCQALVGTLTDQARRVPDSRP